MRIPFPGGGAESPERRYWSKCQKRKLLLVVVDIPETRRRMRLTFLRCLGPVRRSNGQIISRSWGAFEETGSFTASFRGLLSAQVRTWRVAEAREKRRRWNTLKCSIALSGAASGHYSNIQASCQVFSLKGFGWIAAAGTMSSIADRGKMSWNCTETHAQQAAAPAIRGAGFIKAARRSIRTYFLNCRRRAGYLSQLLCAASFFHGAVGRVALIRLISSPFVR